MFDKPLWEWGSEDHQVWIALENNRVRASKEWKAARAKAFGPPSRNQQEDDRRIIKVLIAAAWDVRKAEDRVLATLATWLKESGNTWKPTNPTGVKLLEKRRRFKRLLGLADQDPFISFERLLKLGELVRKK